MSVGPASREANAHPQQSGGYLPPSASQSGYYQHVFHPHQPVYVDNSLPSSDYNPHFQTPLSSHSTSLPQYGYPPTINQSGRQQEAQCPPPLIHHPTQSSHSNSQSQLMDRDLSSVHEPLHNEEETTVRGGRKGGKRRPVNQPQNPAPKKAKQTASSGEAASGKSLRIPKACLNCRGLKTKCTGAGQDTPSCAQCLHKNIECRFDNSDPGQKLKQKRGNLSWQLKRLKGDLDTLESVRFRPVFTPEAPSSEETSSPSRTISDDTQSSGGLPLIDLPNPAHQGTAAKASNQPRELASRAGTQLNLMSTSRLRRSYAERQVKPEILEFINVAEIAELFNLYFDHLNVQCGLLDRDFHTPSMVGARSPFLLTTICAISAKFYTKNSGYYPKLAAIAKKLAFSVLERGYKTVEIVQAYVLLALWSPGSIEGYERDKAWMLLGFAIRIATDLNFHRKSVARLDDSPESLTLSKEVRNRERCWLICYALDRSLSAQMGKPHFIMEDAITKSSEQWWKGLNALPQDAGIVAHLEIQRILSRSLDMLYSGTVSSGLRRDCDYFLVIKSIESQLQTWVSDWEPYRRSNSQLGLSYQSSIMDFYYHYAILVINLFGFQDAVENPGADLAHFFSRCYSSAMGCVLVVCSELVPGGYMRYSPDSHFVFTTYAVLTLLKLAQPRFSHLRHDEQTSFEDAENVASVFESVAANPYHTPALYGAFLRKLVATMKEPAAFASSLPTDGSHHEFNMNETQPSHEGVPSDSSEGLMGDEVLPSIESLPSPPPVDDTLPITDLCDAQPVSQTDESFYPHSQDQMALDDIQDLYTADSVFSSGHELWATMLMPGYGGQLDGLIGGSIDEMMGNEAQHMFGAFDME